MDNALLMYGGFAVAAGILVLIDWLGRRKDKQSRNRAV
jgi:hypothetical protein